MHLRELKYPIAIQRSQSLMGGKNAALQSRRRWNANIADYYLKGGFQQAVIFDSNGNRFEIEKILLKPMNLMDKVIAWPVNSGPLADLCNIDMKLRHTGKLTFEEFCKSIRDLALENPDWWSRHSNRSEIERMFENCITFKDAINDIGVLDAPNNKQPKHKATNIIDLR